MAPEILNLDQQIERLRQLVRSADAAGIEAALESIETQLQALGNPLARGFAYAEVRAALGHPDDAATVLQDLLAVMGDHAVTYYQIGCYRRQAGDVLQAAQAFGRAAELDPTRVDAWLNLGTLLDDRAEPDAAMDAYRQALRVAPTNIDVWRNLGNSLAALDRFEEALSAYETGLGLCPGDRTLVLLRAAVHQALGDVERANALTPAPLAEEVGTVFEVADGSWRCRFRSLASSRREAHDRASAALTSARRGLGDAFMDPVARHEGVFVVRRGQIVVVCDPDPIRDGHPHRFFDASQLVR